MSDVNRFAGVITGEPGESWTNTGEKVKWQLIVSFLNSCSVCIQNANAISAWWPLPFHPGCACRQTPVAPGAKAEPFLDFRKEVEALDPHQQARVMGVGNYRLVDAGLISWTDVVTKTRIRPLHEVIQRSKLSDQQLLGAGLRKAVIKDAREKVQTPAATAQDAARQAAVAKLKAMGFSDQQVRDAIKTKIAARIGIVGKPSGPSGPSIGPIPPRPSGGGPSSPRQPRGPAPRTDRGHVAASARPQAPKPLVAMTQPPTEPTPAKVTGSATGKPAGGPIGPAFHLPTSKTWDSARAALAAIDKVHGDGKLPLVPIKTTTDRAAMGEFVAGPERKTDHLTIKPRGEAARLTMAHEVGHRIDWEVLPSATGKGGLYRAWDRDDVTKEWHDTVVGSKAIQSLIELNGQTIAKVDGRDYEVDRQYVGYLLQRDEVFARSYAQYIAARSGDKVMQAELDVFRQVPLYGHAQWREDDFEPIARAFDTLFAKLGWRE